MFCPPLKSVRRLRFNIEPDRIALPRVSIVDGDSRVELSGNLEDVRHPRGTFKMTATVQARDAVRTFGVPVKPVGRAHSMER